MAKTDKIRHGGNVTPQQHLAITALVKGATLEEAGKVASVSRQTVSGWKNHDVHFVMELNRQLNEVSSKALAGHIDRVREATSEAINCILNSIKAGDVIAARWLIDKVQTFPEEVNKAFMDVTRPPLTYPEDEESIINLIAQNMVDDCLKNSDDLTRQLNRPELLRRARRELQEQLEVEN